MENGKLILIFTIKIKTNEKIVNRLRRDHFQRLKLQQNYTNK